MFNLSKIFIIFIAFGFLVLGFSAIAQEVTEDVNLDENIQPQDLGVKEPRILPDHPLYFLKDWVRNIRSFFIFNPVAKAELKMKFSNERLMEAKKMIEKKGEPEKIERAIENYQKEVERIKSEAEKIREKARENPRVESFLDKFIHQQTLHQKLLQRLENQVPEQAFEKIKEARERHLEDFKDVMLKLEDRQDKITEKLTDILERQKGSRFKHFKNLEVLLELEEKVPEEAKEAIRRAQENSLKRLQGDLEKMSPEDQEKFKEYLERISGEKEKHLEILENLRSEIKEFPEIPQILELRKRLEEGEIKILERGGEEFKRICPLGWRGLTPGETENCLKKNGRIIIEKDPEGCPIRERCIIPGEILPRPTPSPEETKVCITLWDPVCGKDGKTYSNECFARVAGVGMDYEGECQTE